MTDPKTLAELLHSISTLAEQERYYFGIEDIKPQFGPPAPRKNLDAMAQLFNGRLPKDYLGLLGLIDGAKNYDAPDMCLLSSEFLLSQPDLEELFEDAELFEAGEIFIFAQTATDPHSIAFRVDPETDALTVIEFDTANDYGEFETLDALFAARKTQLEERVARQKADRIGLADD